MLVGTLYLQRTLTCHLSKAYLLNLSIRGGVLFYTVCIYIYMCIYIYILLYIYIVNCIMKNNRQNTKILEKLVFVFFVF